MLAPWAWTRCTPVRWRASRRPGRDVRGVHTHVHALLAAGVVYRIKEGLVVPFDAIRVEFTLQAAA